MNTPAPKRSHRSLAIAMAVPGIVAIVQFIAIATFVLSQRRDAIVAPLHAVAKNEIGAVPAARAKPATRPPEPEGKPFAAPVVKRVNEPERKPEPKPAPPPALAEDFWTAARWTEAKLIAKASQSFDVGLEAMETDSLRKLIEAGLRADAENDPGAVKKLLREHADLAGLPFILDDRSRLPADAARTLAEQGAEIHKARAKFLRGRVADDNIDGANAFWNELLPLGPAHTDRRRRTMSSAAALEHILATDPGVTRRIWMERLAPGTDPESTRTLARRALFDFDPSVRQAAVMGLKSRPPKDSADALLDGFRYPWVPVARHAAEAIVKLDRKDLVPRLRALMREPDPYTLPRKAGENAWTIREVVRINHFKNCLLCHSPIAAPEALEARGKLTVPVGNVAAKGVLFSGGYDNGLDLFVRADVTRLRPDFSANLDVKKRIAEASGWPTIQRFDFVVRTRTLTPQDSVLWPAAATLDDSANGKSLAFAINQLSR